MQYVIGNAVGPVRLISQIKRWEFSALCTLSFDPKHVGVRMSGMGIWDVIVCFFFSAASTIQVIVIRSCVQGSL